jgi:L-alanine-DL-glutamate epimerase-like enolase superfamily enzyme
MTIAHPPFTVRSIETYALEAPFEAGFAMPFATSVATFVSLLVRVRDGDGQTGWGEVWANFPRFGGPYRARIVADLIAPRLLGREIADAAATFHDLDESLRLAALQSGDRGAFAQALAGVDVALWDLAAQRAGQPLWRLLGGGTGTVAPYASLGPADLSLPAIEAALARGFRTFKVRAFREVAGHAAAVAAIRAHLGDPAGLAIDANQSWPPERAAEMARQLEPYNLLWLEEPLPADAPPDLWARVATAAPMPLAAGENLYGPAEFAPVLAADSVQILQPDIGKWGGISVGLPLARSIRAAGRRYFPHWFAGPVGLLASAHLLATVGGDGLLEWGAHPYPVALRDDLFDLPPIRDGLLTLPDRPGLGINLDPDQLRRFAQVT